MTVNGELSKILRQFFSKTRFNFVTGILLKGVCAGKITNFSFIIFYSVQHYLEPREKLKEILSSQGMDAKCFFTLAHGEVNIVDAGS